MFRGGTWQEAIPPLLLFLGAYLVRFTSIWLSKIISGRYAEQTSTSLQSELMRKLLELGPRYAAFCGSGQLITLLIDGVIRFRTYLELFVPRMIDMVFVTLPILITVYVLDFISGLILTFTLPVLIAFFILLGYATPLSPTSTMSIVRRPQPSPTKYSSHGARISRSLFPGLERLEEDPEPLGVDAHAVAHRRELGLALDRARMVDREVPGHDLGRASSAR